MSGEIRRLLGRRQRLCISVCIYVCAPVLTLGNDIPSKMFLACGQKLVPCFF